MFLTLMSMKNKYGYKRLCPEEHLAGVKSKGFEPFWVTLATVLVKPIDTLLNQHVMCNVSITKHDQQLGLSLRPRVVKNLLTFKPSGHNSMGQCETTAQSTMQRHDA